MTEPLTRDIDLNEKGLRFERYRIYSDGDLQEPPIFGKIGGAPAMTAGNFILWNGKAKSGKTTAVTAVTAALISGSPQCEGKFEGMLPPEQNVVLYIDTEQSEYHATRTIKRICTLAGDPNPSNLIAYGLRPLTPAERLEALKAKVYSIPNLGAVIIDGIRDLLTLGINDEAEATSLTSEFLKMTSERNIIMLLILHQNKTDLNARGHIGTEMLNKAETTISVTRDEKTGLFVVSCDYSRDIGFEDFAFRIQDGLPVASDLPQDERAKSRNPSLIPAETHFQMLNRIFRDKLPIQYKDLQDKIILGFEGTFGQNASRLFVTYYLDKGWISKSRGDGNKTFYNYERAVF
jgi:hypothetical protein